MFTPTRAIKGCSVDSTSCDPDKGRTTAANTGHDPVRELSLSSHPGLAGHFFQPITSETTTSVPTICASRPECSPSEATCRPEASTRGMSSSLYSSHIFRRTTYNIRFLFKTILPDHLHSAEQLKNLTATIMSSNCVSSRDRPFLSSPDGGTRIVVVQRAMDQCCWTNDVQTCGGKILGICPANCRHQMLNC